MKKEKDLQAELAKRRYKKPNIIPYFIYYVVGRSRLLGKKYSPTYVREDNIGKIKGPAFLIWNHQSRRDHTFLTTISWPRKISIVCGYNEFFREHLHWPLKMNRILPKKIFCNDLQGIRAMRDIIQKGGIVAFSPEGTSSIFGDNQPIVPGTGRFLQAFRVPVYMVYCKGSYLTNTKIDPIDRTKGKVFLTSKLLFSPEDLNNMTSEEIDNRINLEFHHDDYKWNKTAHIRYECKDGQTTRNLDDICYKCPKCGHEYEMEAKDGYIKCKHCGNGATMDEYYDFHPFDDNCVIPDTPSDWVHNERLAIIDEIRKDPNYSFSVKVKIGDLPKDHYVKKETTSEICGEGIITIDHQGFHLRGTKRNKPFNVDLSYKEIWTYPVSVDVKIFSLFINEEYHDFIPESPCAAKILMLTEEMHRLHVNRFKNFPWFDYMYEGKELGIDLKK